jgi:hypothetical protein
MSFYLQLKLIVNPILANGFISCKKLPVTGGASWQRSYQGPACLSFAFSCVGDAQPTQLEIVSICALFKRLYKTLEVEGAVENGNTIGCYPGFANWETVGKDTGIYKTLCFNILEHKGTKCCVHCQRMAEDQTIEDAFLIMSFGGEID